MSESSKSLSISGGGGNMPLNTSSSSTSLDREKPSGGGLSSNTSSSSVVSSGGGNVNPNSSSGYRNYTGGSNVRKIIPSCKDENIYKMSPEAMDPAILSRGSIACRRYTKSALLLLRDEVLSRYRPNCINNQKILELGFWKLDQPNYLNQNGGGGNSSGNSNNSSGRAISGASGSGGGGVGSGGGSGTSNTGNSSTGNQKNLMDHRSISSAHLMPAFVKRRIVGVTAIANNSSSNDPKERVRKEQEPVVSLSPQRKTMNMGCQMPSSSHQEREVPAVRERRIGSGRLPPRDVNWDYRPDKDSTGDTEYNYRSNALSSYREHRSSGNNSSNTERGPDYRDRYERRSYGRGEYDRDNNRDNSNYVRRFITDLANQHSNNSGSSSGNNERSSNHDRRRQYSESREEPEWFSGGPTSQHDTIELRGFDENEDMNSYNSNSNQKTSGSSHKTNREQQNQNHQQQQQSQQQQPPIFNKNQNIEPNEAGLQTNNGGTDAHVPDDVDAAISASSSPPARSTPTKVLNDSNNNTNDDQQQQQHQHQQQQQQPQQPQQQHQQPPQLQQKHDDKKSGNSQEDQREKHIEFNFDAFLNVDPLNNFLVGDQKAREVGSSRFSQWFKRTDQYQKSDSRRSSLHEELNNMINVSLVADSSNSPNRQNGGGGETDKYFAPISPAANSQTNTLLEFLQRGKFNAASGMAPGGSGGPNMIYPMDKQKAGMIPSVEELEARMRKNEVGRMNAGGEGVSGSQQQDMEAFKKLLEQLTPGVSKGNPAGINALTAALQQQQQQQVLQQMLNRAKQEEIKKMLQQQQILQQHQQRNFQLRVNDLLMKIANGQVSRNDVLKRPEAHAVLQGLARGDFTQAALLQQMTAPNVSARYREIIITVLNYLNQSSRVASPSLGTQQILSPIPGQPQQHPQQVQVQAQQQQPQTNSTQGAVSHSDSFCGGGGSGGGNNLLKNMPGCVNILPGPTNATNNGQTAINASQNASAAAASEIIQPHLLFQQHQAQKQMRLSPLPNGLPQRIPSPRELQYHTQTIMQSALIKKKLEEQQENFRRRQEIQKQQQHQGPPQPGVINNAMNDDNIPPMNYVHNSPPPIKQSTQSQQPQINSPTPLAFTPTSVLRKMTAEKDSFLAASTAAVAAIENAKAANKAMQSLLMPNVGGHQQQQQAGQQTQPRMILGGGNNLQQQNQQNQQMVGVSQPISPQNSSLQQAMRNNPMKWNSVNLNQLPINKPMGRPILKGGPSPGQTSSQILQQQQLPFASKIEYQQQLQQQQQQQQQQHQQRNKTPQQQNLLLTQIQQQQQHQHLQQLFHQRQRAAIRAQYQMQYNHMLQQQQQQQGGGNVAQSNSGMNPAGNNQMNENTQSGSVVSGNGGGNTVNNNGIQNNAASTSATGIINYQRDGGLSPTSNQLARWFSPELLAQASAGKLPSLNMGQALSLEEFERSIQHSPATVHN